MNTKRVAAVVAAGTALVVAIAVTGRTGGLRYVTTAPGILGGSGTISTPLTASFTTGAGWSGTGSAGDPLVLTRTWDGGVFGSGWDGDCTFDGTTTVGNAASSTFAPSTCWTAPRTPRGCETQGTGPGAGQAIIKAYTITRDIYCDHLTVSSGVYVYHPGFKIFAKSGIVNNGWIGAQGQPPAIGSEQNGGSQAASGSTVSLAAAGGNQGNNGSSGQNGVPTRYYNGAPGSGGGGGDGGDAFPQTSGGTFGTTTVADSFDPLLNALAFRGTQRNSLPATLGGGGGGGGGDGFSGCLGGGGGSSGGIVVIAAPTFTGSGVIHAPGGNGANASDTCPGGVRQGGGGGGGKGGWIILVYSTGAVPTTDVYGGLAGNQSNGLAGASNGASGFVTTYKIGPQ